MKKKIRIFTAGILLAVSVFTVSAYAGNCDMGEWSYTSMDVKVHYYISLVDNIFTIEDRVWLSTYMYGGECSNVTEEMRTMYFVQKGSQIVTSGTLHSKNRRETLDDDGVKAGHFGKSAILYMQNKYDNPTPFSVTVSD